MVLTEPLRFPRARHFGSQRLWIELLILALLMPVLLLPLAGRPSLQQSCARLIAIVALPAVLVRAWRVMRPRDGARIDADGFHLRVRLQVGDGDRQVGPGFAGWASGRWPSLLGVASAQGREPDSMMLRFHDEQLPTDRFLFLREKDFLQPLSQLEDGIERHPEVAAGARALPDLISGTSYEAAAPILDRTNPPQLHGQTQLPGLRLVFTAIGLFVSFQHYAGPALSAYFSVAPTWLFTALYAGLVAALSNRSTRDGSVIDLNGEVAQCTFRGEEWMLQWDQVLGVAEIYISDGGSHVALLHSQNPQGPTKSANGSPPDLDATPTPPKRPVFELAQELLPKGHKATGWCLIPSDRTGAGHGELLTACLRGMHHARRSTSGSQPETSSP